MKSKMNYWELRKQIAKIIPRMTQLYLDTNLDTKKAEQIKEKGRKKNYQQYNIKLGEWRKQERLLNTEEINSFMEISIRAAACPMPFNMDIWDGLLCPFGCIYCFANAFRASLYTAFFDNAKTMGFRHCNSDFYKREIDKMLKLRTLPKEEKRKLTGIYKAFSFDMPIRMGVRFEDFLASENKAKISLNMIKFLTEIEYPLMINTKSHLIGKKEYVKALSTNPAKTAVHVTAITSNEDITRRLEPAAPTYAKRLVAIKNLTQANIRVVARIEPYLFLVNDNPDEIKQYMEDMWEVGVRNITFDTYSYTAYNPVIRQSFINAGYDFDRIYLAGCDSQFIGSLLLGKFMELFRERGFSSSTFDMGNVPSNNQAVCCEVEDWFIGGGFNYGCTVMAARFISDRKKPTTWKQFYKYVYKHGGFLTEILQTEVHHLWNLEGNSAYSHSWAQGLIPCGYNEDGLIWSVDPNKDDRLKLLEELI